MPCGKSSCQRQSFLSELTMLVRSPAIPYAHDCEQVTESTNMVIWNTNHTYRSYPTLVGLEHSRNQGDDKTCVNTKVKHEQDKTLQTPGLTCLRLSGSIEPGWQACTLEVQNDLEELDVSQGACDMQACRLSFVPLSSDSELPCT